MTRGTISIFPRPLKYLSHLKGLVMHIHDVQASSVCSPLFVAGLVVEENVGQTAQIWIQTKIIHIRLEVGID